MDVRRCVGCGVTILAVAGSFSPNSKPKLSALPISKWVPDEKAENCALCKSNFWLLNRRQYVAGLSQCCGGSAPSRASFLPRVVVLISCRFHSRCFGQSLSNVRQGHLRQLLAPCGTRRWSRPRYQTPSLSPVLSACGQELVMQRRDRLCACSVLCASVGA